MWIKYFSRGMSVQKALDYADGAGKLFFDFFGTKLDNQLYIKNKENVDIYCQDKEFENLLNHLSKELENDIFFDKFYKGVEFIKNNVKKIEKLLSVNLDKHKEKLIEYILKIRELRSEYYPIMWYTVLFESRIEEIFLDKMKKYPNLDPNVFLAVDKPTFIAQEEIDLLKLAQNPSSELLANHASQWAFIPMYDYDYQPYDINYFREKLSKIKNPEVKLKDIQDDFRIKNERYKKALNKVNKEDKKFFEFFHFSMWFKDERSKFRNYEAYVCRPLYQEIAGILGVDLEEIINLTYDEMVDYFKNKSVDKNIIASRKELFALVISTKNVKVLNKNETVKFIKKYLTIEISENVKGVCASRGKVTGIAKIVLNSKSINKVKTGDVLISPMTRPDFVPAMKKASAIVTDEGGLTCHAAIVAREMKKPCIIGTKVATQVFKDGDMVEVDANTGIVRKI